MWPGDAEGTCTRLAEGETGGWACHSFVVDESWQTFDIFCEASNGALVLRQGKKPDDESLGFENENKIMMLRAKASVLEAQARQDDASLVYAELKRCQQARPKAFCTVNIAFTFEPSSSQGFPSVSESGCRGLLRMDSEWC